MPRWLSEGISVYEERQASPTWGQRMNPDFREMILRGGLTPVGKLSGAFLSPPTPEHLQFAYYQSSLVVEHIVERFGHEAIRAILEKLSQGVKINVAIAQAVEPIEELEVAFATYARTRAEALGPKLDWSKPVPDDRKDDRNGTAKESPNFYVLSREARRLAKDRKWEEVKATCRELIKLFPEHNERGGNPYVLLAKAHRELNEFTEERKTLEILAGISGDAYESFVRLIELGEEAGDWEAVQRNADRALAVNPLLPRPHRQLALAAEAKDQAEPAIESWRTLLELKPEDPAEAHFHLARLLRGNEKTEAKRQLLMALEEAPRFREAHRLLLDWNDEKKE
jgi:tetratricopeptide (TPR) repeat protein